MQTLRGVLYTASLIINGSALFVLGVTFGPDLVEAAMSIPENAATKPVSRVQDLTRAGVPDVGQPVRMQCQTAADADSGALDAWETYRIECDGDTWVVWGTAAVNAAANDTKLRAGLPEYFSTDESVLHVSCLSIGANTDCRITKMH